MKSTPKLLIDNHAFAKRNELISGILSPEKCPRLAELLPASTANNSKIHYQLQGRNEAGRHLLQLSLDCLLTVQCQRCLSEMPLQLKHNFNYLIVDDINDTEGADLDSDDDVDLQQSSPNMDLLQLIEDEIIMALPIAPIHENNCTEIKLQSGEKPNPFAVLKGLVK